MATYIEPKTDWQADDYLTYVDYNRIKNNLVYLNDKFNDMYPNPYTFDPGEDMSIDQMFKASTWNMFEDCVEHFQRTGKIITFGERSYYKDNGHLPDYNQLNRLEKCIEAYAPQDIPVTDFVLSDSDITLFANDTHQLNVVSWVPADATYKTVTWISSDTSLATISNSGLITAVSEGNVTITATCPDGISKNCSLTVVPEIVGENLIELPYYTSSSTKDGITFTVNNDGSVHCYGTAEETYYNYTHFRIRDYSDNLILSQGRYVIGGAPDILDSIGTTNNVYLGVYCYDVVLGQESSSSFNDRMFTLPSGNNHKIAMEITVKEGTTVDITFYPQLYKIKD